MRTSSGGMAAVSRGRANSLKAIRHTGTRSLVSMIVSCRYQTGRVRHGGHAGPWTFHVRWKRVDTLICTLYERRSENCGDDSDLTDHVSSVLL